MSARTEIDSLVTAFESGEMNKQITSWKNVTEILTRLRTVEIHMRNFLVDTYFNKTEVGTQNMELGHGWKLKAVVRESYKLDSDNDKLDKALASMDSWQADRLVKFHPKLSVSEYKKLNQDHKATIDQLLTITPAAPTLTLVEPKAA